MDVRAVGNAVVELGGGRRRGTDAIDYRVGLTEVKGIGETVSTEVPIAFIHAGDQDSADAMVAKLKAAISVDGSGSIANPVVLERLTREQSQNNIPRN